MAKRRYDLDEGKIARYVKEGRGKGQGTAYKPWLKIQDVPSMGRSSRVHGYTTGREHHFLSDLETGLFFILEWSADVTDIREQFPLDRDVTRMLAEQMGITHPCDRRTNTDLVMTTDFLVDVHGGGHMTARSVKPADELADNRILEKLELERRYWQREGVPWHLVTDRDLPRQRIQNIRWLHEMHSLEHREAPHASYWADRCDQFLHRLGETRCGTISDFLGVLETAEGFGLGEPMTALRHLAAHRVLTFDLEKPFSTKSSITALQISKSGAQHGRRSA
jgi:hypothetical protein